MPDKSLENYVIKLMAHINSLINKTGKVLK